jgi:hypothetical protein
MTFTVACDKCKKPINPGTPWLGVDRWQICGGCLQKFPQWLDQDDELLHDIWNESEGGQESLGDELRQRHHSPAARSIATRFSRSHMRATSS